MSRSKNSQDYKKMQRKQNGTVVINGKDFPVVFQHELLELDGGKKRREIFYADIKDRTVGENISFYPTIINTLEGHGVVDMYFTVYSKANAVESVRDMSIVLHGTLEGYEQFSCQVQVQKILVLPFRGTFVEFPFSSLEEIGGILSGKRMKELKD